MKRPGRKVQESFLGVSQINEFLAKDSLLALEQFRNAVARFNENGSKANEEEADFYAKGAIRAFLGHVDGIGYFLRRVVLASADECGLDLPLKKRAELMERKYDSTAGTITQEEKHLSTESGIKLAVKTFPQLFGSDFVLDTSGEGWKGFKRLVHVRNKFTHPTRLEHLYPRLAMPAIQPATVWFLSQMRDMLADCGSKLGVTIQAQEVAPPEFPFKEKDHPAVEIFSEQDISDIKDVAGRTLEYVKLMLERSSSDTSRSFTAIRNSTLPIFSHPYQYAVRNAVRTLFSDVEARTAAALFFIDGAETRGEIKLSEAEREQLSEGEIEDELITALTIFSREFGNDVAPRKSGELWKQFRGARFFRDRLTHPHDISGLRVDTKKVQMLLDASQYFNNTWEALKLDPDKYVAKAKTLEKVIAEQEAEDDNIPLEGEERHETESQ